jgi:hypothetical protein
MEDAVNDKYCDRVGENLEGPTIHHPGALAQQYCHSVPYPLSPAQDCTHPRQCRHTTINVPSPRQFNVGRQSVGCICPEKRHQSTTITRIKPYLEYPDRSRRGKQLSIDVDWLVVLRNYTRREELT